MPDIVSKEKRSKMMAAIGSKTTKPEIAVRKHLHSLGYRYRIGTRIFGFRPDIVLPKYRTAIFVHGCFWHRHEGCKLASVPKTNSDNWKKKFETNILRDKRNLLSILDANWTPIVIWECSVRSGLFYSTDFGDCIDTGKQCEI